MGGTWTYAGTAPGPITQPRDQVRLQIGDIDPNAILFYDEEIDVYLNARGDAVLVTSADLCDAAATKFARGYDFSTDGQTFNRSQMVAAFTARAKELRARASGLGTLAVTKVDGYSWDIPSDQLASAGTANANPRQTWIVMNNLDRLP